MVATGAGVSTRQGRRKARTRALILDAAQELFVSDGETATIERIAETADVAIATIYQHFGSKDGLHYAIVDRALEANERHMLTIYRADYDPVEKLIDAAGAYLQFYFASPQLFRMVQLQHGLPSGEESEDPAAILVAERISGMNAALEVVVAEGIRQGSLRKVPVVEIARFLWGTLNGVIGLAVRPDPLRLTDADLRAVTAAGIEVLIDGLVSDKCRGSDGRLARRLRERIRRVVHAAGTHGD